MKNKILNIIICGILLFGVLGCQKAKEQKDETSRLNRYMLGTTLDDGRVVHFAASIPYKDSSLDTALLKNELSIEDLTNKLKFIRTLNDGGSKLYYYDKQSEDFGEEDFYMLVCNSIDGSKDIYVNTTEESLNGQCSIKIDDLEGVSMTIKGGSLTDVSATLVITDTSGRENIYGDSYRIDKKENDTWVELKPLIENVDWTAIGYTIGKDKTLKFDINWENIYGRLEKGTYRIVKDTSEPGETPKHYITVEFSL